MSRRTGDERPEGAPEEAPAPEPESGLQGVDAAPLPALTREQVEELRRERDDLADQLLRRRAEFDNYRKRTERERQSAGLDQVAALLRDLVPTLDNLDRALAMPAGEASLREGVEMIRRGLLAILEAKGVSVDDPRGAMFDPSRHQALSHEPTPGAAEGTVVEVYQKGYSFGDRLLRPALVKVAAAQGSPEPSVHHEPEKVH